MHVDYYDLFSVPIDLQGQGQGQIQDRIACARWPIVSCTSYKNFSFVTLFKDEFRCIAAICSVLLIKFYPWISAHHKGL